MLHNSDKWKAALVAVIADRKSTKPTEDQNCAIATLRVIRDGMCDDTGNNDAEAKERCEAIRESLNELIQDLQKPKQRLYGFASNSSAAAKAAGCDTPDKFAAFVIKS